MTSPASPQNLSCESLGQVSAESLHMHGGSSIPVDSGDRGAWLKSVLEQFEGPLLRYALRLTRDLEAARDAVQETFLRVCREEQTILDGHLAPWLFRVCRSRVMDAHRKEQRMSIAPDLDLHALPGNTSPPDVLAQRETSSRILILLESLPANQQEVIRLKFQDNLSYREIAEVTGLSVSNVGVQLHNGLKQLRKQLKEEG